MRKILVITVGALAGVAAFVSLVNILLPIEDKLERADAIIVVSGGDTAGRTFHGVNLYKKKYADKLIFSGAAKDPKSASNAEIMKNIAINRGVPVADIIIEERSRDTKENAAQTSKIIGEHKKIILVTSAYHQRRMLNEFQKAFPEGVTFINSPAEDKNWKKSSWFLSPYGWWISITEPLKLLFSQVG